MRHYDLVVIGTGSGNSIVDDAFRDLDVAIVEHGGFGGTCVNVGCIPTKMFAYTAEVAATVRAAGSFNLDARLDNVRWSQVQRRVLGRIDGIAEEGERYRVEFEVFELGTNRRARGWVGTVSLDDHILDAPLDRRGTWQLQPRLAASDMARLVVTISAGDAAS